MARQRGKTTRKNPLLKVISSIWELGLENFGRYYSTYRAVVVDNNDPLNLQRVKLVIPQVTGGDTHDYWAMPKGVWYGKGYGTQVVPQLGDLVWVEFEGGAPEVPIWTHGHPGKKEVPEDTALHDKDCYWFLTPKGHKVVINDTKNYIEITSRLGDTVIIDEEAISLITKKKISLGSKRKSEYKAVLGEKNKEVLEDINMILGKIHGAFTKDLAALTKAGMTNTVKIVPELLPTIQGLKAKIDKILSDRVTLDK